MEQSCEYNSFLAYGHLTKEKLEKLHTKQLLKLLNSTRHFDWTCECCGRIKDNTCPDIMLKKLCKEILATRPHIPNKKESKEIRKQKIKHGSSKECCKKRRR